MDGRLHAYIDETGTNELDMSKSGVSEFFICVAVVIDEDRVENATQKLNEIAQIHCSGAEIKSSSIGNNHKRRTKFLEAIKSLNFGYYAMLIRKDSVWKNSGLQFKPSFYKCINQMLYRSLTRSSRSVQIIADEIGGRDFMESFKSYLARELKPDLFFTCDHEFAKSEQIRLIQLADLIAGTLAQCYEPSKRGEHSKRFRDLLKAHELAIDAWPPEYCSGIDTRSGRNESDDLRPFLMARVGRFISEHESSSDSTRLMQVAVLRSLLFAREFEKPTQQLISSDRLMTHLVDQGFEQISKRAFTKEIIGGIRMEGVIIAGTKNGYRLALGCPDIREYLDHNKSIIEPMLARLREAQKAVKLDTANDVDIVSGDSYRILSQLLDCTSNLNLDSEDPETKA